MGSGKTAIGRRLSCTLNYDFFDTDFEIVNITGVSIEHIFSVDGEAGFRKRETKVLKNLINIPNIVIATGGGIILRQENIQLLHSSFVIYLSSTIEILIDRCLKSQIRPLINNAKDKRQTIIDIVTIREPIYKQVANVIINTSDKKLYAIINNIKDELKRHNIITI